MPKINYGAIYRQLVGELPWWGVSGVTTIIKSLGCGMGALIWWAFEEGKKAGAAMERGEPYADNVYQITTAMDAGSICHTMMECHIKGLPEPRIGIADPEALSLAEAGFVSFLEWWDLHAVEVLHTELSLVSETHGFGGTLDCVANLGGKRVILDWKTSNGVYESHLIQLSAYKALYEETFDEPIQGLHLLRVSKDQAGFTHHYWDSLPECWEAFLCALEAHKLLKKIKKLT